MLNHEQMEYLRSRIQDRMNMVSDRIHHLRRESFDVTQKMVLGNSSAYDNHPGDWGSETYEREKDFGMLLEARDELRALEAALSRMERGDYGRCRFCGKDIPFERLRLIPEAEVCVECAGDDTPRGTGADGPLGNIR